MAETLLGSSTKKTGWHERYQSVEQRELKRHGELVNDQLLSLYEQRQGGSTGLLYARIEGNIAKYG